jgi:predicted nucleic acid-binding protein
MSMSIQANNELGQLRCSKGMAAGILDPQSKDDATHVAAATVARADAIVSWNFKHLVRIDKMRAYNQVNLQTGFGLLSIVSPQEVRFDEPP